MCIRDRVHNNKEKIAEIQQRELHLGGTQYDPESTSSGVRNTKPWQPRSDKFSTIRENPNGVPRKGGRKHRKKLGKQMDGDQRDAGRIFQRDPWQLVDSNPTWVTGLVKKQTIINLKK